MRMRAPFHRISSKHGVLTRERALPISANKLLPSRDLNLFSSSMPSQKGKKRKEKKEVSVAE